MQEITRRGFFEDLLDIDRAPIGSPALWPLALFIGWAFDFLFWGMRPGISFPIFVALVLAGGALIARSTSTRVAGESAWLINLILAFSLGSFFRAEPLTLALNYLATILLMGILADSLTSGRWVRYRLVDHVLAAVQLIFSVLARPSVELARRRSSSERGEKRRFRGSPVVRGILLATPVLVVFALLFASADPIFSRILRNPFDWIESESVAEILARVLVVGVLSYLLGGLYLHAISHRGAPDGVPERKARTGGSTEALVVLAGIDLLFAAFVAVQLRYFFAGEAAVKTLGMTYSDYARQGFGQLVAVAILTLFLFLGLSLVSTPNSRRMGKTFSVLGTVWILLTSVILVSALQRLLLYEDAYGFTRLRTYTHVFIFCLAALLVGTLALQWLGRLRAFAFLSFVASMAFLLSLNVMGVDAFVANRNLSRWVEGQKLDLHYLSQLSSDAVPVVVARAGELAPGPRAALNRMLSCASWQGSRDAEAWQSFHFSRQRARRSLGRLQVADCRQFIYDPQRMESDKSVPKFETRAPGGVRGPRD